MDMFEQIIWAAAILAYGVILARLIPAKLHFISNITVACTAIIIGLNSGLSLNTIGLGRHLIPSGIFISLLFSAVILFGALAASHINFLTKYFLSQGSILKSSPSRLAYESAVRIPLSTALTEEVLFRGVLLAVFLQHHTTLVAMILSSIVFGLWHVFPSINSMNQNIYNRKSRGKPAMFIASNVLATSIAGMFFAWLKILSNSIIAPWLTHWTINAGGIVAVLFTKQLQKSHKV
jgi:membrane protease YdiL (CAAX protease family)